MMSAISLSELQDSVQGKLIGDDVLFSTVSTDSRNVADDALFVALKGDNFDGHGFVEQACQNGAKAALVEAPVQTSEQCPLSQLQVKNTLIALGKLARLNRQRFHKPLFALTGSAGKTTTKEMLAAILAGQGEVLATSGNYNNEIGVPLTLFELQPCHQYAVIEMGAAKAGDIAYLMSIAEPDVALITNAMPAHIEGFGSLENIARSKAEIFSCLKESGIAVINLDDDYADLWLDIIGDRKTIAFSMRSHPQAKVNAGLLDSGEWCSRIKLSINGQSMECVLPVPGEHNVANALAAAASAYALGVKLETIVAGLESFSGVKGRLQLLVGKQDCRIIDDSYNANPGSVKSAIDVLAGFKGSQWLVLGEMAELGGESEAFHQQIGDYAREKNISQLFCVGEKSVFTAKRFGKGGHHFNTQQDLIDHCQQALSGDEVVLIKGSRSARMENVVNALMSCDSFKSYHLKNECPETNHLKINHLEAKGES